MEVTDFRLLFFSPSKEIAPMTETVQGKVLGNVEFAAVTGACGASVSSSVKWEWQYLLRLLDSFVTHEWEHLRQRDRYLALIIIKHRI